MFGWLKAIWKKIKGAAIKINAVVIRASAVVAQITKRTHVNTRSKFVSTETLCHRKGRPSQKGDISVNRTLMGHQCEHSRGGLPPEKWSSLMYGLWPEGGLKNAEEETHG